MKKKVTKEQVLGFGMAIAAPFIMATCDNGNKPEPEPTCECPNGTEHNEGEECCDSNDCGCEIILNCACPEGTIHLVGEEDCRGPNNCECEKNVPGARAVLADPDKATNGMIITNRDGIDEEDFAAMVTNVNTALDHTSVSAETRQNFIRDNIKEIKILPVSGEFPANPIISDGVLIVENGTPAASIRTALNVLLVGIAQAKDIYYDRINNILYLNNQKTA